MKITIIKEQSERKKKRLEKKEQKKKSRESDAVTYSKKSIESRSIAAFIISLLVFIISYVLKLYVNTFDESVTKTTFESIVTFLESVSGIILGISIGGILLDFFSYIKFAQERIREVIIDKDFLKTIDDNEKRRIIDTLESSLYFKGENIPSDSLYTNIKEKVLPHIEKAYFTSLHAHIDCEIKGDKIHKKIYNDMTVFAPNDNYPFKLPIKSIFSITDIKSISNPWQFIEIELNGEKVSFNTDDTCHLDQKNTFNQEEKAYSFERKFTLHKGENKIRYTTHSIVNISDNTYTRTISLPCKSCTVDFHLKNDDYTVKVVGFAVDKDRCVKPKYYENGCRIEFCDWTLPGDGCVFVINEKEDKAKFKSCVHFFQKK